MNNTLKEALQKITVPKQAEQVLTPERNEIKDFTDTFKNYKYIRFDLETSDKCNFYMEKLKAALKANHFLISQSYKVVRPAEALNIFYLYFDIAVESILLPTFFKFMNKYKEYPFFKAITFFDKTTPSVNFQVIDSEQLMFLVLKTKEELSICQFNKLKQDFVEHLDTGSFVFRISSDEIGALICVRESYEREIVTAQIQEYLKLNDEHFAKLERDFKPEIKATFFFVNKYESNKFIKNLNNQTILDAQKINFAYQFDDNKIIFEFENLADYQKFLTTLDKKDIVNVVSYNVQYL